MIVAGPATERVVGQRERAASPRDAARAARAGLVLVALGRRAGVRAGPDHRRAPRVGRLGDRLAIAVAEQAGEVGRNLVAHVLDEPAVAGTYYWGRWSTKRKIRKHESEWLSLSVTPIVIPAVHQLAMKLRAQREPSRNPGRPTSPTNLLAGVVRCGKCGASYQRETSGKRTRGDIYRCCYYNCRRFCRIGTTACSGYRIRTNVLDDAVLAYLASVVCTPERTHGLEKVMTAGGVDADTLRDRWTSLMFTGGDLSRSDVLHLVDQIVVRENDIEVLAR
ncbi:MAG: recombinase zinc beta ribbon domain-containing protein, partial [Kofleriaceae bacterium]